MSYFGRKSLDFALIKKHCCVGPRMRRFVLFFVFVCGSTENLVGPTLTTKCKCMFHSQFGLPKLAMLFLQGFQNDSPKIR